MTIETQSKSNLYSGNDVNTTFPYNYLILDSSHLEVIKRDSSGNETTLILDSDYSVSGVGSASGGDVTYPISGSPLATGESIFIKRNVPYLQLVDLLTQGEFSSDTVEQALDYLTMMSLQLKEEIDRAPKVDATTGETGQDLVDNFEQSVIDAQNSANASASSASASASSASASASSASASATSASNAATSEANAAVSEANAASAAASVGAGMYEDVVYKTFADSPITIVDNDRATLFEIDCSGGNVVVNLPTIAGLATTEKWHIGFKKSDLSANKITINPSGTDEINGNAQEEVLSTHAGTVLIPDLDQTPDQWSSLAYGAPSIASEVVNITAWEEHGVVPLELLTDNGPANQPENVLQTEPGNYGRYASKRVGSNLKLKLELEINNIGGRVPAIANGGNNSLICTEYLIALPNGLQFDSSVKKVQSLNMVPSFNQMEMPVHAFLGDGTWQIKTTNEGIAYALPFDDTRFRIIYHIIDPTPSPTGGWAPWNYGYGALPYMKLEFEAPIAGWTDKSIVIPNTVTLDFDNLNDTPSTYSGKAGKAVVVNQSETGLEFSDNFGQGQSYEIFQNPLDFLTNTSSIWELDLSRTQDIVNTGPALLVASNSGSATTRFTATQDCSVVVSGRTNVANQNSASYIRQVFFSGGEFDFPGLLSGASINGQTMVTAVLNMKTGDYFQYRPGRADNAVAGSACSANENFGITFQARAI